MWFRVVTNKDGGIASCDAVEGQEHDGKGIFYVDAQTPAAACLAAKQMWLERYEKNRSRMAARQAARQRQNNSQGLCLCGKPVTSTQKGPSRRCRSCIDHRKRPKQQRRHYTKKACTAEEKIAAVQRDYRRPLTDWESSRLATLKLTLADFRRLSPLNAAPKFEGHLVAQIAELEAKRQQKPEPKAQAAE
jgi:hypothetical protein